MPRRGAGSPPTAKGIAVCLVAALVLSGCMPRYSIKPETPSQMPRVEQPLMLKAGLDLQMGDGYGAWHPQSLTENGTIGQSLLAALRGSEIFTDIVSPSDKVDILLEIRATLSRREERSFGLRLALVALSGFLLMPFLYLKESYGIQANITVRDRARQVISRYDVKQETIFTYNMSYFSGANMDGLISLPYRSLFASFNAKLLENLIKDRALWKPYERSVGRPTAAASAPAAHGANEDAPRYAQPEKADDFALVVGVEKYPRLPDAQFAERDARAVSEHLHALGVPQRNIFLLTGQEASRAGLTKNIETRLSRLVNERSTVYFYYSGHGAPDAKTGQAYLLPVDGDPQFLEDTAYPLKRLYDSLSGLKAKKIVVAIDSCFSGAGARSVLPKGARPLVTKVEVGFAGAGKVVALTASEPDQISGTMESQGHGLFTYFLLKGLNGAAQDAGGHVTLRSLHRYLAPQVADAARRENRDQAPLLLPAGLGPEQDVVLR